MKNNGWKYQKIGDLVKIRRGSSPRPIDDFISSIGMPWVKISDATSDKGRFIKKTEQYIKKDGIRHSVIVKPEDLIISNSATPGLPKIMKIEACIHDGWLKVDEYKNITRDFLFYSIRHHVKRLVMKGNGSIFTNLKTDILRDFEIPLPDSISEQNKITNVLNKIEDKIELNNKINAELEAMAKLIYDYWFVQFDFPDENGKPYKSSGRKMVWCEELKRKIPEGWSIKRLDLLEPNIVTGKTPSTADSENFQGLVPFICIGDLRQGMHVVKTEINLSEKGANLQKNKFIPSGSICVSCIASPGLVALSTKTSQTNQQLNSVVIGQEHNRYFLYFYLKNYFKYSRAKTGNTFANMNKEDFSSIKIITPSDKLLRTFSKIVEPLGSTILNNLLENEELSSLRDWLLPMLMNGQVKVQEN